MRDDVRTLDGRTAALLAGTCVPAAVAGLLVADRLEQRLSRPGQLAALLAAAGALLWVVDHGAERRDGLLRQADAGPSGPIGRHHAALAAFAQIPALVPGVSRSGATLTALRAAGVDRQTAERFSVLMSLPVTAGAAVLTLARADPSALRRLAPCLGVGAGCAALAGAAAARVLRRRPGRTATGPAMYRLALAAAVLRKVRTTGRDAW
jgi:undecaprenyl-diphosphatase